MSVSKAPFKVSVGYLPPSKQVKQRLLSTNTDDSKSPSVMPKALPNTLLTSFYISLALHAVFIEIFPTKPISASSLRFFPCGIWMGIVRE